MSHTELYSLNARNIINWKRNFKENIIKNTSVFMQIRGNFPDISYLSETQKNNFQFLRTTAGVKSFVH